MWYYKLIPSILNLHKIFFYILISFIQIKDKKTYTKYKFINLQKNKYPNYYFLKDLQVCEKKSNQCDCLLLLSEFSFLKIVRNINYIKRLRIYDMDYFGHFGLNMILKIQYFDLTDLKKRSKFLKDSIDNLAFLKQSNLKKSINLLGNNSSYSEKKNKIVGNLVMICNDAVKDVDLINKNEVILAIADPLFFLSETEYAKNYLEHLKKIESKLKYIITPIIAIPLLKKHNISTPVIGVNSSRFQNKIYREKDGHIISKKSHNIFTQYMLPIAIYLDINIYIGGFSLTNDKKTKGLWSYDKNVVKKESKNFAFKYSFFKDRNFDKYYKKHYIYLNKFLNKINKIYEL